MLRTLIVALVLLFGILSLSLSAFTVVSPNHTTPLLTVTPGRSPDHNPSPNSQPSQPSHPSRPRTGIIGNISFGWYGACETYQNGTNLIVPNPSDTNQIVVTSQTGDETFIPATWFTFHRCLYVGSFLASLTPGNYSLTLAYCLQDSHNAGCPNSLSFQTGGRLPITVTVEAGKLTPVMFFFDTGAR